MKLIHLKAIRDVKGILRFKEQTSHALEDYIETQYSYTYNHMCGSTKCGFVIDVVWRSKCCYIFGHDRMTIGLWVQVVINTKVDVGIMSHLSTFENYE